MPWIGSLLRPGVTLPTGGAETQIYLLTRALSRCGVRVCVIAFETPEGLPRKLDGVDIVTRPPYVGHEPGLGKANEVINTWSVLRRVPTRVLVTRAAGPYVPLVAAFARVARRRFVYSSASDIDFTSKMRERYGPLYWLGMRSADTLVVQTERQLSLCKTIRRPAVVIRSITESAPVSSKSPVAFLWIGRLVEYKRPLEFVELARRVPEAQFRMVAVALPGGDGEGIRLAERIRREAATIPNLRVLQPQPRPQLMELADEAVAIVNTSEDGWEGMPNTLLEGWTRGIPALALSHDPDDVIERHRLGGSAAGSRNRLAELAVELWRERTDREDLSLSCRRYIDEHHSAHVVAGQWMRVLGIPQRVPNGGAAGAHRDR